MATVQRYVNTASSGGDGTTNNTSGGTAAYASLSSWEANAGGSATDDYVVDCCGTAADTTAVIVDFTTNLTTGSVTVRANTGDGAGKYNGTAVISTSHYRLAPASSDPLAFNEDNCNVDGIQIEAKGGSFFNGIKLNVGVSNGTFSVKNCRIRAATSTDYGIGSGGVAGAYTGTCIIQNNLIVGFNTAQIDVVLSDFWNPTVNIYQNTCYGDGSATGIKVTQATNAALTANIKGNAIGNSGASNCFNVNVGAGGTVNYDDNATEDAQGTNGEIAIGTLTNAWTNPGTAQSSDFTVKNTSSSLYNAVNPTLVTTDITGFTRDGTNHDVGCFEFQSAGPTYTLTAAKGTFTLTGNTTTLLFNRVIAANKGTYTLTGQNASLIFNRVLSANRGMFTLTGQPSILLFHRVLLANKGTFSLTGQDVTLTYTPIGGPTYTLTCSAGSFNLTGQNAALLFNRVISANTGVFTLTGNNAGLYYTVPGTGPVLYIDLLTGNVLLLKQLS